VHRFHIITFYEFKSFDRQKLNDLRLGLKRLMRDRDITGTMILAEEGFNSTVCGAPDDIALFIAKAEALLESMLEYKLSVHDRRPFKRVDVKIKPEIVTLKKPVDIANGAGTHVSPEQWNEIISDPSTVILDARNDYEFRTGSFTGAINPETRKFSELPDFVEKHFDPHLHKRVAMFCTGGIRCEKLAPYMKERGFDEVYQLSGGILKYLETVPDGESRWQGECFVFDDRITVDVKLEKGNSKDLSQVVGSSS
jgi:UPF0176 protein